MTGSGTPQDAGGTAPYDPAVQPERTRLAWRRTGLAFVVVVVLAWRSALVSDSGPAAWGAAVALTLVCAVFLLVLMGRTRALTERRPPPPAAGRVLATGAVVGASVVAALPLVLLG